MFKPPACWLVHRGRVVLDVPPLAKLPPDDRAGQAARVADYLEQNPDSTLKEIDKACDTGCVSKVLSAMVKQLGYGIKKSRRDVPCAGGLKARKVRSYSLLFRPHVEPDLFTPE